MMAAMSRYGGPPLLSLFGLLLAIILAVACSTIARGKGRGPVVWAILGFFFGIIALVIILVLPRRDRVA